MTDSYVMNTNYININNRVKEIKNNCIDKKRKFGKILECFPIKDDANDTEYSINNYIINEIYKLEKDNNFNEYIYWIGGGFSWNNLIVNNTLFDDFDKLSTAVGILEVNYINSNIK